MDKNLAKNTNRRGLLTLAVVLLLAISLSGCLGNGDLRLAETWTYENEVGFRLVLPEDWQLIAADTQSSLFVSADGGTSLTVISELGGEAYYTLAEIADMLMAELAAETGAWQLERTMVDNSRELRQLHLGQDSAGVAAYLDIYLTQPYAGIRFYLLFAGADQRYSAENRILTEIIRSFRVTANQEELYTQMELRREAEQAAAEEEELNQEEVDYDEEYVEQEEYTNY